MANLVDHILSALETGTPEQQEYAIVQAAFLFEKATGRPNDGWTEEVANEPVSRTDVERLSTALVQFVSAHLPPPPVASAVSALGVLRDSELKELYCRCLRAHIHGDSGILYAAMISLRDLGEAVFPSEGSASFLEFETNRDLAAQYLKLGEA